MMTKTATDPHKFVVQRTEQQKERGSALRSRIASKGYTLTQFGAVTGLGRSCIWRITKGQDPTEEQARIIESALH